MNELLLELIRPTGSAHSPDVIKNLARHTNWQAFCSVAHRTSLAPLAYERLQDYSKFVPEDILEQLRRAYYETAIRNVLQLNILAEVTTKLKASGVPVLALKGLVLAHLGVGLRVRRSSDIDLLVQQDDFEPATKLLTSLGYLEIPAPPHKFHRGYLRVADGVPMGLELHFDLVDRSDPSFRPDVQGIWARSLEFNLLGHMVRAPELSDHLLLTMIQLHYHDRAPRLLADICALISRWGKVIDWEGLIARSEAWGTEALFDSTVYIMSSMLRVDVPRVVRKGFPPTYFRRVQWHIARRMIAESLNERRNAAIFRIASVFMADQLSEGVRLLDQKTFSEGNGRLLRFSNRIHQLITSVSCLPALLGILLKSAIPMSPRSR